jgi:hypothetical protein
MGILAHGLCDPGESRTIMAISLKESCVGRWRDCWIGLQPMPLGTTAHGWKHRVTSSPRVLVTHVTVAHAADMFLHLGGSSFIGHRYEPLVRILFLSHLSLR